MSSLAGIANVYKLVPFSLLLRMTLTKTQT